MSLRRSGLVSAMVVLSVLGGAAHAGTIFSENFSTAQQGTYNSGVITGTQFSVIGGNIDIIGTPVGSFRCEDSHADNCLDLVGAGAQGVITTAADLTLHAGATYTLDFGSNLQGFSPTDIVTTSFNVILGGVSLSEVLTAADSNHHFTLTFNPMADVAGAALVFQSVTSPDNVHGAVIDNIVLTETLGDSPAGVPEPSSWALMILGLGGAGALLRRRVAAVA